MIDEIIESFNGKIESLNLFEKIYPLVEQKEIEGNTILGWYLGKGQFEHITNFDNYRGVAYFRKYEDVEISPIESETRACQDMLSIKYPIRFVCCIRRDLLLDDCAFSDDAFSYFVVQELSGQNPTLKTALRASRLTVSATKISTDRKRILEQELPGNDLKDLNYEFALISIDFNVAIEVKKSCMLIPCESYG